MEQTEEPAAVYDDFGKAFDQVSNKKTSSEAQ